MGHFTHIWSALRHYHSSASSTVSPSSGIAVATSAVKLPHSDRKHREWRSVTISILNYCFLEKIKDKLNAKNGPKVADGNVAMRTEFSGRLESK